MIEWSHQECGEGYRFGRVARIDVGVIRGDTTGLWRVEIDGQVAAYSLQTEKIAMKVAVAIVARRI